MAAVDTSNYTNIVSKTTSQRKYYIVSTVGPALRYTISRQRDTDLVSASMKFYSRFRDCEGPRYGPSFIAAPASSGDAKFARVRQDENRQKDIVRASKLLVGTRGEKFSVLFSSQALEADAEMFQIFLLTDKKIVE
uniref:Uncharacterized protein n=1 Tax=Trichogramma kaykai TaxID=54128 RepID=A0ABD2W0X8_9HYME